MRPAPATLRLLGLWIATALAASLWPPSLAIWATLAVLLIALLSIDAVLLLRIASPRIERRVAASVPVGVWSPVQLELVSRSADSLRLELFDGTPASMRFRGQPYRLTLEPAATTQTSLRYQIYPERRGEHVFEACQVRITSPLGLLRRKLSCGEASSVRVYPNFRAVAGYSLLAIDNRTSQLGIKKRPRRGEGLDFHQLREYREGDALRQIEWRATARMGKLISREYQDERDQQVLFLLDCGRKMHAHDGDLSHFDHALNAVLLLSYVALRQGDAVGLMSFSGERRWLAPRKSPAHLNAILNGIYDLQTSTRPSDYLYAAQHLATHQKKRALIIWVTNLRDEENRELLAAVRMLAARHLVLVASVRERALREAVEAPVHDFDSALRHAAAQSYLLDRERCHARTRASGVSVLDVEPERLPVALVNRYLDIKSRRIL